MLCSKSKKITLIVSLLSLLYIPFISTMNNSQTYSQNVKPDLKRNEVAAIIGFTGLVLSFLGIALIIEGILKSYDLPLTYYDHVILALRSSMSKQDLEKHKLSNKIKYSAKIFVGILGCIGGLFVANIASAISKQTVNPEQKNLS